MWISLGFCIESVWLFLAMGTERGPVGYIRSLHPCPYLLTMSRAANFCLCWHGDATSSWWSEVSVPTKGSAIGCVLHYICTAGPRLQHHQNPWRVYSDRFPAPLPSFPFSRPGARDLGFPVSDGDAHAWPGTTLQKSDQTLPSAPRAETPQPPGEPFFTGVLQTGQAREALTLSCYCFLYLECVSIRNCLSREAHESVGLDILINESFPLAHCCSFLSLNCSSLPLSTSSLSAGLVSQGNWGPKIPNGKFHLPSSHHKGTVSAPIVTRGGRGVRTGQ